MEINQAYILAAGKGTRMGELGICLPKILWPINGKTMLEWQIIYLQKIGIKKIYINIHHQSKFIKDFLKVIDPTGKIVVLDEIELLGSGGAIHNLFSDKMLNNNEPMLLVNGDQFLFLNESEITNAVKSIDESKVHLFCIPFDSGSYNQVIIKENKLVKINSQLDLDAPKITFSGVSLINLKKLSPQCGISSFFESVADYKNNANLVSTSLVKMEQYIDFGTLERYVYSLRQLLSVSWRNKHLAISNFFPFSSKFINGFEQNILDKKFTLEIGIEKAKITVKDSDGTCTSSLVFQ